MYKYIHIYVCNEIQSASIDVSLFLKKQLKNLLLQVYQMIIVKSFSFTRYF